MPVQASHHFSVTDYYRLPEIGLLRADARVELLDGQIFDLFSVSPLHTAVTRRIAQPFLELPEERASSQSAIRCGWTNSPNQSQT